MNIERDRGDWEIDFSADKKVTKPTELPGRYSEQKRPQRERVDMVPYLDQAQTLLRDHPEVLKAASSMTETGGAAIAHVIGSLPDSVVNRFYGHGITKGTRIEQVAAAIAILSENVIVGGVAPLRSDNYAPYSNGSFLVVSRPDHPMLDFQGKQLELVDAELPNGHVGTGYKVVPGALVCNPETAPLAEDLQKMFPNVRILTADTLEGYLTDLPD